MFYIYGLHLEGEDEIRYVGSTIRPVVRLWQHLHGENQEKVEERIEWVRTNRNDLRMKLLETGTENRRETEQRWIAKLRSEGHRLLNRRRATRKYVISDSRMSKYLDQFSDDLG